MADDQTQTQGPPPIQPPSGQVPPYIPPPPPGGSESEARMWNMWCHLSALAGFVVPFGQIIGPLIIWQIKKSEFPSVDIHGKASLNFQITVLIAIIAGVLAAFALLFFCIGYLLFPFVILVGFAGPVFAIIAGIKANNGEDFKYPWSLELVK